MMLPFASLELLCVLVSSLSKFSAGVNLEIIWSYSSINESPKSKADEGTSLPEEDCQINSNIQYFFQKSPFVVCMFNGIVSSNRYVCGSWGKELMLGEGFFVRLRGLNLVDFDRALKQDAGLFFVFVIISPSVMIELRLWNRSWTIKKSTVELHNWRG